MDFQLESELKLSDQIFDVRFHPNSQTNLLAAVTIAGEVHLIEDGQFKTILKKHHKGSSIRKVRFTSDGKLVTIAKTVKVHDLEANKTLLSLKRDDDNKTTFYATQAFGEQIITAGDDDGVIFVWDLRTPDRPIFKSHDCEQYISDIDGRHDARKFVCTSGEGTLTAYDLRSKKMIEPQSELFEAGFQCVKLVEANKKVVIGGEDGAIYVFNQNEWAHTSAKFAVSSDAQNRGKCSIDCLELLPDGSTFVVGCSDGRVRSLTLWPHQLTGEKSLCKRASLESIHLNPNESKSQLVVCGDNYINFVKFEEKPDEDDGDSDATGESSSSEISGDLADKAADDTDKSRGDDDREKPTSTSNSKQKKLKLDTDDYLNVFK